MVMLWVRMVYQRKNSSVSFLFTGCLTNNYLQNFLMDVAIKSKTKYATDRGNYRPLSIAAAASKQL